ncbi:MAG: ABC transporter permease [Pirellulaceae bacterium]|nr:ABC transporter permease [Pirellulaceae bacterium]
MNAPEPEAELEADRSSPNNPARHSAPGNAKSSDTCFWISMSLLGFFYLILIVSMIVVDFGFTSWQDIRESLADSRVQFSIALSLLSCTISAILSIWVAIPTGFVLARMGRAEITRRFGHKTWISKTCVGIRHGIDTLLDIPIVLPPLVVGISLLVLFQTPLGRLVDHRVGDFFSWLGYPGIRGVTYEIPAIIIAQFTVAAAFAIRTMRDTFEQISERPEQVAHTLGASRFQSFSRVSLPQAWRGIVAGFTLAWARSLGEFGPILIFAGTSRLKTEVLSTTVYLNFQFGNLRGAVVASLILVCIAIAVLVVTRVLTLGDPDTRRRPS